MPVEEDLEKIIGDVWFVRGRFDIVSKHKGVLERSTSVEDIVHMVARKIPEKMSFPKRLVLDNYLGSLQHFVTGYDLSSIHLSSKAMEVALLVNIKAPTPGELAKRKGRVKTFEALRSIAIERGLIDKQESRDASRRVIDRRNMAVHDAILKEAVEIEQEKWWERMKNRIPEAYRRFLVPIFFSKIQDRAKQWKSLPDFSWYVTKKSDEATRKYLKEFFAILDQNIDRFTEFSGESLIACMGQLPQLMRKAVESVNRGDADFIKYCARENLKDVKVVLDDIYENKLFR